MRFPRVLRQRYTRCAILSSLDGKAHRVYLWRMDAARITFREWFRELEISENMTKAELARRLGCERQSIHRWLSGKRPSAATEAKILKLSKNRVVF